ncbi:T9SS type B sorting domain-containing protein [Polaribacter haliotis]|uniref:T9SS type B sorting domain-containing protein n=1 Tax=Polaribacter haliotis TaxID=1888915 RepID=A0A7L8AHY6_9FLAO|nr:T9SS type B sorting domain-containing protein [Polaribacter haliotis]QOD61621.1 T9SS type B sorting domain-containing protein [Polaribacter haliotis]
MKKFFPLFLIFIALNTFSQKEANFWYFGFNAGLDFTDCDPKAIDNGKLNTFEGCSTISNSSGELLFYSDGITVWDKNHDIMPGGTGLRGNPSSAQSALFVPHPTDKDLYYLFVVGGQGDAGFFYYTIDITQNGGLGSVITGPVDLSDGNSSDWTERVTAIQSSKSNEIWVISASKRNLYSYLVNNSGVERTPIITNIDNTDIGTRGSLKVSPDGTKLVITSQGTDCLLFNFNADNGRITNKSILNAGDVSYGAEFSQTGNRLYISTGSHNQTAGAFPQDAFIYQFDLTKRSITDINNSRNIINNWLGYRGALQLGPDARIYYATSGETSLGVINKPEELGSDVIYEQEGISLGSKVSSEGLPPFIQSFFKVALTDVDTGRKIIGEFLVCIGDTKNLGISSILDFDDTADTAEPITYEWYRDGAPLSVGNTSQIVVGNPGRDTDGIYSLKAIYFNKCGRERSLEAVAQVRFEPKPTVNSIDIYDQCDYDSNSIDGFTTFNLESKEPQLTGGATDVIVEFFEDDDTPIIDKVGYINRDVANITNHVIKVKITNTNTGCFQFGSMELKVTPTSGSFNSFDSIYEQEINISSTPEINSEGSNDAIFNFEAKIDDIILASGGAFNRTDNQFSFYQTREDAEKETDVIKPPYDTYHFTNETDIYVRISKNNTCEGIGLFKLFVLEIPEPMGNTSIVPLCINFPENVPVLETKPLNGSSNDPSDTYKWYLNNSLISGETDRILNASKEGTYKVEASRFYGNDSGTEDDITIIGYNTFTVEESSTAIIESLDLVDDQDLLEENTLTIKVNGKGNYEYALNSNAITAFRKGEENLSYTFTNVEPGLNTVYIRDIKDCGIVSTKEISFVYFQRHFSPNEDGEFDTWKVQGIDNTFYTVVDMQIFDRYGKLLKVINLKTESGWNGTINGKMMPSNDYWYNATLIDKNGKVRKKTGNFALIRK